MEAQSRTPDGEDGSSRRCESCETQNIASARFCKQCGASFAPPPQCPSCKTELPKEARFCPSCGIKVVGLRPAREAPLIQPASQPPPAAHAPLPTSTANEGARDEIKALADNLPRVQPKGRSSNMLGNVLLFVAACAIFIVVMYAVNKDAAKEVSPFMGGPAPGSQQQPAQQAPMMAQQQQPSGAQGTTTGVPIKGTVNVSPDLLASAPNGTVFIIVRMAGMPDRGPPIAVKKIEHPSFPVTFEVGPGDVMMQGMPFDGPFDLYARLDADGNAMTKAPGDLALTAPKSGVKPGQNDVEIVLDKRL